MLLGQSDEGPAEQRAQRQRVPAVGQDTRHGDKILDLLLPEQTLAGLCGHCNAALFQRSLIAPEVGARRGEQRNVARAAGAHFPGCVIVDRHATDHPRTHLGDGFRFRVAPRLRVRFCLGAADVDVEREHAAMAVQVSMEGVKFGETGLARAAERTQEALVDEFQDFRTRTEIRRNHA